MLMHILILGGAFCQSSFAPVFVTHHKQFNGLRLGLACKDVS